MCRILWNLEASRHPEDMSLVHLHPLLSIAPFRVYISICMYSPSWNPQCGKLYTWRILEAPGQPVEATHSLLKLEWKWNSIIALLSVVQSCFKCALLLRKKTVSRRKAVTSVLFTYAVMHPFLLKHWDYSRGWISATRNLEIYVSNHTRSVNLCIYSL